MLDISLRSVNFSHWINFWGSILIWKKEKKAEGVLFPRGERWCLKVNAHKESVPMEGFPRREKQAQGWARGALMEPWWCSGGLTSWSSLETNRVVLGLLFICVRKVPPTYFIPPGIPWGHHPGVPCALLQHLGWFNNQYSQYPQRLQGPLSPQM